MFSSVSFSSAHSFPVARKQTGIQFGNASPDCLPNNKPDPDNRKGNQWGAPAKIVGAATLALAWAASNLAGYMAEGLWKQDGNCKSAASWLSYGKMNSNFQFKTAHDKLKEVTRQYNSTPEIQRNCWAGQPKSDGGAR